MQRGATEWPIHSFTPCAASLIPCNPTHVILCNPVPSVIRFSDSGTAAFDKAEATGGSAAIEDAAVADADAGLSSFVSEAVSESARPDLTAAPVVIAGGRGMKNGENFGMLEELADKLGALATARARQCNSASSRGSPRWSQ